MLKTHTTPRLMAICLLAVTAITVAAQPSGASPMSAERPAGITSVQQRSAGTGDTPTWAELTAGKPEGIPETGPGSTPEVDSSTGQRSTASGSTPTWAELTAGKPVGIPETGPGSTPEGGSATQRSVAMDCYSPHYCAWTGGYFTGPYLRLSSGYMYGDWGVVGVSACSTSGKSGPNWRNCATSLKNLSGSTAYFARGINGTGGNLLPIISKADNPKLITWDNDIESSIAG